MSNVPEKAKAWHVPDAGLEKESTRDVPADPADFGFSPSEQRSIVRKVDFRLVTTVGLMYCVSLIDRTNLSNAAIAGMLEELRLVNQRYVSPVPT